MEDDFFKVLDAKRKLRQGIVECQKWLAEMCHGLADVDIDGEDEKDNFGIKMLEGIAPKEYDNYFLAKCYFDVREYDRAAHLVRNASSPVPRFLHLYATYMAVEKRRMDSTTDQSNLNDSGPGFLYVLCAYTTRGVCIRCIWNMVIVDLEST
ncbi:cell division cycle protein 23 homolog [Glossina fuscipes]|uniref:Cell division cycle protein 23 homolog n=1 Tax=Glossina fuscipes TaxID=7396 RepID=A0A9C5ZCF4_9MUSC|nr:cell division cycle protein 23 homolog [Glossina fuscipes]